MFILESFDSSDVSWKYTFVIMMVAILIVCGIYTYVKYYLQKKKEKADIVVDKNDEYSNAILDNEDIILKKKKGK